MNFNFFQSKSNRFVYRHESVGDTYRRLLDATNDYIFVVDEYKKPVGVITLYELLKKEYKDEKYLTEMEMNKKDIYVMNQNEKLTNLNLEAY